MEKAITFNSNAFLEATRILSEYYGLSSPEWFQDVKCSNGVFKIECDWDDIALVMVAEKTNLDENAAKAVNATRLLIWFLRRNTQVFEDAGEKEARRREMLALYRYAAGSGCDGPLYLRNKVVSARIGNCGGWFWKDMVLPYLKSVLNGISPAEAEAELAESEGRRGRRADDIRMAPVMWGTYRMLRENGRFRTPMPNSVCNYILKVLEESGIIPKEAEKDTLWTRAQLRYLAKRPVKLLFDVFIDTIR